MLMALFRENRDHPLLGVLGFGLGLCRNGIDSQPR